MNKFTGKVVVSVKIFTGKTATADVNGLEPIYLKVIGGKSPNRTILSGTVADNEGFEVGKTYLAQVSEDEVHEVHGRQFIWTKIVEMSAMDVLDAENRVGAPVMFDVKGEAADDDIRSIKKEEKELTN